MEALGGGLLVAILLWILFGAIAGWIASAVMRESRGFWGNVFIGILGGILGGILFRVLGIEGGWVMSLIAAVVGAVLLLFILRAVRRRPATTA